MTPTIGTLFADYQTRVCGCCRHAPIHREDRQCAFCRAIIERSKARAK